MLEIPNCILEIKINLYKNMSQIDAQEKIEEIYQTSMQKLEGLYQLQKKIIGDALLEIEQEKIKRLQDKLSQ